MGIKGLTTQAPRFPKMGVLRKGGKKKTIISKKSNKEVQIQGDDLDYFRYTSDTHPESVSTFQSLFDKPQELTVLLPYSTVDENFEAWKESWKASRLTHRCDGEFVTQIYNQREKSYIFPAAGQMACPGGCKQVGRLSVIIPDMLRSGHVGTVTAETHSIWDIVGIHQSLMAAYQMRGNLQGIEFILYRYQKEISTPEHGRQMKWLVGIKPNHEYIVAQLGAQMQAALPSGTSTLVTGDIPMIESKNSNSPSLIEGEFEGEFTESIENETNDSDFSESPFKANQEVVISSEKGETFGTFKEFNEAGLAVVRIKGDEYKVKPERLQAVGPYLKEEDVAIVDPKQDTLIDSPVANGAHSQ